MKLANLPNGQIFPLPDWSKIPWIEKMREETEKQLKELTKNEN